MTVDIGTSIVVVAAIITLVGGVISILALFRKPTGEQTLTCTLHGTVTAAQKALWDAVAEMRTDIKTLLQRTAK